MLYLYRNQGTDETPSRGLKGELPYEDGELHRRRQLCE